MTLHHRRLRATRSNHEKGDAPVKTFLRIATLVAFSVLLLTGCTQTKVSDLDQQDKTSQAQEPQMSREQMQMLREIHDYQKKSGQEMQSVLHTLSEQQKADQKGRPHPVIQDVTVARALADAAAQAKDGEKQASLLHRLRFVLTVAYAELPASVIVRHLERARCQLGEGQPSEEAISVASREVMAAIESAMGVTPADLVPPVLTKLESVKESLDTGNIPTARMKIIEIQQQVTSHKVNRMLRQALAAAKGAEEAFNRQAEPVVAAELSVVESTLKKLCGIAGVDEKTAKPAAASETADQAAPEETSQPQTTEDADETLQPPEAERQPAPAAEDAQEPEGSSPPAETERAAPTPSQTYR
ncbi:MAG: hypothetical protein R6V19_08610 [Armatimonadota bacterium]